MGEYIVRGNARCIWTPGQLIFARDISAGKKAGYDSI